MKVWNHEYTKEYELLDMRGSGGEGSVYLVEGQPDLIAKIYTKESLERRYPDASGQYTWTMQEKVAHMASVAPSLPLRVDEGGDEVLAVAWPQVPLFDADNQFVGFLMPRVATSSADGLVPDLHVAYRERERKYLFGESYTWLTAIRLAKNLSTVVRELHEHDVVVGDFNCNNILIDRDAHVTLIDADSFCVRNDLRGITYKCVVGVSEFVAPELQGMDFSASRSRRTFTKESDCFSLAIHIFMLLMNGTHPFSGSKVGTQSHASSSAEPYVQEIASGACPFVTGSRLTPFGDTPRISALPAYVRNLFDRAFGYATADGTITDAAIRRRPTALEWMRAMETLEQECLGTGMSCPINKGHVNPPHNETCMWCELDGKLTRLAGEETTESQLEVEVPQTEPKKPRHRLPVVLATVAGIGLLFALGMQANIISVHLPADSDTSAMTTRVTEQQLDDPIATVTYKGKNIDISTRDVITTSSTLSSSKMEDGTYDLPSAEDILATARTRVIEMDAESRGITVSEEDLKTYSLETLGTDDISAVAETYGMDEESVRTMMRSACVITKWYEQTGGPMVPARPVEPNEPADGNEHATTPDYANYIINIAGDEWDAEAGKWKSADGAYATALSSYEFTNDAASYAAAYAAYQVSYSEYAMALEAHDEVFDRVYSNATITISTLVSEHSSDS